MKISDDYKTFEHSLNKLKNKIIFWWMADDFPIFNMLILNILQTHIRELTEKLRWLDDVDLQ